MEGKKGIGISLMGPGSVGAGRGGGSLGTAPGPFFRLVGVSLNRARLCGQALSRGFWAYREFRMRGGYLLGERRRTISAAYRTARTSGPQVSSLPSTGREQSEIASGCGRYQQPIHSWRRYRSHVMQGNSEQWEALLGFVWKQVFSYTNP